MSRSDVENIIFEEVISGGWNWSHIIKRGSAVRLTDLEGGANVSALFYSAANTTERYNMGDTLKIQHISFMCKDRCIYSDMGRVLMSLVEDSCGWHDVICGVSNAALMDEKTGIKSYQQFQNSFTRNGYDSLLTELAKHGLGKRDFTETINFFSKVEVDDDGDLTYSENHSKAGDSVLLRAEMDTLLVLDTGMHSLNSASKYLERPMKVAIETCPPATIDDGCRNFCPENKRGFFNTEQYHQ